jgi:uncharacterized protein (DUF2141 family)
MIKALMSCLLLLVMQQPTDNPRLTIQISNIEKLKGEIKIGVFNKESHFLKEGAAIKNYSVKVDKNTAVLTITDLPKGEYAISMYHDENMDKKMNTNFIGIPKESYGFSNNIRPRMSAPKYKDCKFSFSENTTLNIKLISY